MVPKGFLLTVLLTAVAISESHPHKKRHLSYSPTNQVDLHSPFASSSYKDNLAQPYAAPSSKNLNQYGSDNMQNGYQDQLPHRNQQSSEESNSQQERSIERDSQQEISGELSSSFSASGEQKQKMLTTRSSQGFYKRKQSQEFQQSSESQQQSLEKQSQGYTHYKNHQRGQQYPGYQQEGQQSQEYPLYNGQQQSGQQYQGYQQGQQSQEYPLYQGRQQQGRHHRKGKHQQNSEQISSEEGSYGQQQKQQHHHSKHYSQQGQKQQQYSDESFEIRQAQKAVVRHPKQALGGRSVENQQANRGRFSQEMDSIESLQNKSTNNVNAIQKQNNIPWPLYLTSSRALMWSPNFGSETTTTQKPVYA